MARRDIGKEIIEGLEALKAWRLGKTKLRTTTVELPRAVEVAVIRKELGLSQEQFARFMGVSVATLRNWEQGRREPHGPARSLLLVASREPAAVLKALRPSDVSAGASILGYSGRRIPIEELDGGVAMKKAKPGGVAQKRTRYRVSKRGRRAFGS